MHSWLPYSHGTLHTIPPILCHVPCNPFLPLPCHSPFSPIYHSPLSPFLCALFDVFSFFLPSFVCPAYMCGCIVPDMVSIIAFCFLYANSLSLRPSSLVLCCWVNPCSCQMAILSQSFFPLAPLVSQTTSSPPFLHPSTICLHQYSSYLTPRVTCPLDASPFPYTTSVDPLATIPFFAPGAFCQGHEAASCAAPPIVNT